MHGTLATALRDRPVILSLSNPTKPHPTTFLPPFFPAEPSWPRRAGYHRQQRKTPIRFWPVLLSFRSLFTSSHISLVLYIHLWPPFTFFSFFFLLFFHFSLYIFTFLSKHTFFLENYFLVPMLFEFITLDLHFYQFFFCLFRFEINLLHYIVKL